MANIDFGELTAKEIQTAFKALAEKTKILTEKIKAQRKAVAILTQEVMDVKNNESTESMIDIRKPNIVGVTFSDDYSTLWINIDNKCKLRVCEISKYEITLPDNAYACNISEADEEKMYEDYDNELKEGKEERKERLKRKKEKKDE